MNARKRWIDTLKLFAIFWVFFTHFISSFHADYFSLWSAAPTSFFLKGITGKLGVSFLGICSGYFAYHSKETNASIYIVRRYLYFFICCLFINLVTTTISPIGLSALPINSSTVWTAISDTVVISAKFGNELNAVLWFILPFFLSCVISYINGKSNVKALGIIFEIIGFILIKQIWIAVCLIGSLVASIEDVKTIKRFFGNKFIKIIVLIGIFFAINRSESDVTYFIDGICSALLFLVIMNSCLAQKALNSRFLSSQGKNVMAILLIHVKVYGFLGRWLFNLFGNSCPYVVSFIAVAVICWATIVLLSYPINFMLNYFLKVLTKLIRKLFNIRASC